MRKFLLAAAVAVAALFGTSSSADAAFRIRVSENGGATYVLNVTDNGVGDLANPTVGAITAFYSDSVVMFSVTVGQSKPLFGNSPFIAAIDISLAGTFGTGGTITVDITDTDFTPPLNPAGLGQLTATIGSSAPAGSTFTGYLNGDDNGLSPFIGNKEFGGIDATNGSLLTVSTTAPGNLVNSVTGIAFAPYSLSARTVFSGAAGTGFSIDNKLTFTNPAPAGLVLALAGMPVFGIGAWIRRRRAAVQA